MYAQKNPQISTRLPHTVTFMESAEYKSVELSDDEKEELFCKDRRKYSRPRMSSVFFMTDSPFAGGIISRSNYMTRCFRTVWNINAADIPGLQLLLWNGSSQQIVWQAIVGLLLQWLVLFLPVLLFIHGLQRLSIYHGLIYTFLILEFVMFLWYMVVYYVLAENQKNWKRAWFTFEVTCGTIGLVDSGESDELTLFHFSANIRFVKVKLDTVARLHTISKHEQDILKQNMMTRGLECSEIILYTEDFVSCYSTWPKNMTMALLSGSLGSLILAVYFVAQQG